MTGLDTVGFYAACAIGVVLWLLPALILSVTYAVCSRSAERAYRDGHRDGYAAADFMQGERAAGRGIGAEIALVEPEPAIQTDAALISVAAQLVDIAEHIRHT
jgi:hypothetical protein